MHPGGQAAAQVVKELIGNALAGADAAAAVDALDHRGVYCARGANGWEAGRGDPASNNEQTAEAAADQR
jgi:hypothetical protein